MARLDKMSAEKAISIINAYNADIVVLTETSLKVKLKDLDQSHSSLLLPTEFDGISYKSEEVRTAIYSKHPIIDRYNLNDNYTNCAAAINTPLGKVIVYATIIGIFGNRDKRFTKDLDNMTRDIMSFPQNIPLILVGDLNQSFSDNYYFTNAGRQSIVELLEKRNLANLTADLPHNIDHTCISRDLISNKEVSKYSFNKEKSFSDHIGVIVDIL